MTKKTVLCYGDSITWGYNPATQNRMNLDERWTGILANELKEDYLVVEEGLKGRTTTWNDPIDGASKNGLNYLIPCLESHKPIDLCILLLGLNDLKKRFSLPSVEIARGITVIIQVIKNSKTGVGGKAPKILLVTPPIINPVEGLSQEFRNSHNKSRKLPGYYEKIAQDYGLEFLDISKIINVSKFDGVHIDVDEQLKLGNIIIKKVKEIMK
jgi:lysophospholipase L1-like esterase